MKKYENCVVLSKDFYVTTYGGYAIYFDKSKYVFFSMNVKEDDMISESCIEMIDIINKKINEQKKKCVSEQKDNVRETVKDL